MPSNRDLFSNPKSSFTFPVVDNIWHRDDSIVTTSAAIETDPSTNRGIWKRCGDTLVVKASFIGVTLANSVAYITLPFGLTIDYCKLPNLAGSSRVGSMDSIAGNTTAVVTLAAFADGSDLNNIYFSGISGGDSYAKGTGTGIGQSTDGVLFNLDYAIPILEWNAQ